MQQRADKEVRAQADLVTDVVKRLNQSIFVAQSQLNSEMIRGAPASRPPRVRPPQVCSSWV